MSQPLGPPDSPPGGGGGPDKIDPGQAAYEAFGRSRAAAGGSWMSWYDLGPTDHAAWEAAAWAAVDIPPSKLPPHP